MIKEFSMCGTLGDVFIVYCKLYNYWEKTGEKVGLRRYNKHVSLDKPISDFFFNIPFVKYLSPCKNVASPEEIPEENLLAAPYINVYWDGNARGEDINDPPYIKMEPYPNVFVQSDTNIDKRKICVGIQLHSGKLESNFKGFSLRWVIKIKKLLPDKKCDVFLFGTGDGYKLAEIEKVCKKYDIHNFVAKTTINQWLSKILMMDYFITPEGLAAFFAMSQRIPSIVFFTTNTILCRVPPIWRKSNLLIKAAEGHSTFKITKKIIKKLIRKPIYLSPLPPTQVKSLIESSSSYI
jgi:hypothetical protein